MAGFGETVLFPMLKRERAAWGQEVDHAGRWAKGVWVGRSWNSNESLVLHAHGISRPRTVKRLVDSKKWRTDLVEKVTTMPWGEDHAGEEDGHAQEERPARAEEVPLEEKNEDLPEQKVRDDPAVRGLYLRRADFQRHGWTEGCAKCRFMVFHPSREGGPVHSDRCKSRLIDALKETIEGRTQVQQT